MRARLLFVHAPTYMHYRNQLLCHLPRQTAKAWMADGKGLCRPPSMPLPSVVADGKVADSCSDVSFRDSRLALPFQSHVTV